VPGMERRRALARAKLERQMARRAAGARRRRRIQAGLGAAVAVAVVVAGVWFLVTRVGTGSDTVSAPNAAAAACAYVKAPGGQEAARDVGVPTVEDVVKTGTQTVTLKTNMGTIAAQLDLAGAPCAAHSFVHLAEQKYFDGTTCHRLTDRVVAGKGAYVLQCGDPTGTGHGGPGYQFADENLPTGKSPAYPAGTLAMANAGSDTNGSQFFIVYKDSTAFDPAYTVFGTVTSGLDVVQKIAGQGTKDGSVDGPPKRPVRITAVTAAAPGQ
jgi:peptidyl-prolyl cis-trans isomerase B (cyclophilin B)